MKPMGIKVVIMGILLAACIYQILADKKSYSCKAENGKKLKCSCDLDKNTCGDELVCSVYNPKTKCLIPLNKKGCNKAKDCAGSHTRCNEKTCSCIREHHEEDGLCVRDCSVSNPCKHPFKECGPNGACQCKPGYKLLESENRCRAELGSKCLVVDDCSNANTMCSCTCHCKEGFIADNGLCVGLKGFMCPGTSECLPREKLCDKTEDCTGKFDEVCPGRGGELQCGNSTLFTRDQICDGTNNCASGEDEKLDWCNCNPSPTPEP